MKKNKIKNKKKKKKIIYACSFWVFAKIKEYLRSYKIKKQKLAKVFYIFHVNLFIFYFSRDCTTQPYSIGNVNSNIKFKNLFTLYGKIINSRNENNVNNVG